MVILFLFLENMFVWNLILQRNTILCNLRLPAVNNSIQEKGSIHNSEIDNYDVFYKSRTAFYKKLDVFRAVHLIKK